MSGVNYNYQDQPMESQSEWLGKTKPESNESVELEWLLDLEKRVTELEKRYGK